MNKTKLQALTPVRSAVRELLDHETVDRIERIEKEFSRGFEIINKYINTVTVFGSARSLEDNIYYQQARELTFKLAQKDFTIITGGGGGIMEAANRGAYEASGRSIGFNIELPHEQRLNPYTTESMPFRYFFARKVMLAYAASALVCFPGGYGTLDELFEVMTLVQTGKMPTVPIILVGKSFWKPLDLFFRESLLEKGGFISHGDEDIYKITDDIDEIVTLVEANKEITSIFPASKKDI